MTWHRWALFALTELVLCLTPGPAVLFVVATALGQGTRRSIWANLGILSGNTFYFILSAAGLGAVLVASHTVFLMIKYAGAAYLVYLGVATFRGHGVAMQPDANRSNEPGVRILARAFATQAANPKALLFFAALLPQFIAPGESVARQILILGLTSIVVEFGVLFAYGALAAQASRVLRQPRFATVTNRAAGGLLVGAGVGLGLAEAG
jgi:threonine/homoserine/homoserine lactone efflux protein